jgi:hypothetical protein
LTRTTALRSEDPISVPFHGACGAAAPGRPDSKHAPSIGLSCSAPPGALSRSLSWRAAASVTVRSARWAASHRERSVAFDWRRLRPESLGRPGFGSRGAFQRGAPPQQAR